MVGGGDLQHVLRALLGGVGDLAVVEDDGVAVGAALVIGPADALGELGLGVGEEQLKSTMLVEGSLGHLHRRVTKRGFNVQCHHR